MLNFDAQFVQRNDVSKDHLKDAIPEFCLIDSQSYSAEFWSCFVKRGEDNLTRRLKESILPEVLPTSQFSAEIRIPSSIEMFLRHIWKTYSYLSVNEYAMANNARWIRIAP